MQNENEAIVLVDEDGNEHTFVIVDVVMVDDNRYALLEPVDGDEDEEDGAYLFRLETVDGEERLVVVEDDEEFERVVAALEEFEDDEEYDEEYDDHEHGPHCHHDH